MTWAAVAVAGASLVSGYMGSQAAGKAADQQAKSGDAAIAAQQRQFDLIWGAGAGQRAIGNQALNALGSIYGYSAHPTLTFREWRDQRHIAPKPQEEDHGGGLFGGGFLGGILAPSPKNFLRSGVDPAGGVIGALKDEQGGGGGGNAAATQAMSLRDQYEQYRERMNTQQHSNRPNYNAFYKSPDYQFRKTEGMGNIGNSFAARGGAASGNALKALTQFNSGLAASEFGNYFNRQAALAGIGQTALNTGAQAGMNAANNIGNALQYQGDARASGIMNQSNAWSDALGGVAGAAGYWNSYRRP